MRGKLTKADIQKKLENSPGWKVATNGLSISRNFAFASFAEAFGFMTEVAIVAEKLDHHPEWTNIWRKLSVTLTTHSANGVTDLDFKLAAAMDEIAKKRLVLS